ncbi:mesoderm-specific transcript homolog protein [Pezoporus flaviventris]|uniref:mesoderm-specific transcript homolog protein n=1 Tax=Pezoporus flaviventris TaxID=889875 RepID=UPI002AAFD9ED|nr:mesoderm-specific transcript homolog protein [Pezoporus flaviventris]
MDLSLGGFGLGYGDTRVNGTDPYGVVPHSHGMKEWWVQVGLLTMPLLTVYLHIPPPGLSPALLSWRSSGGYFTYRDQNIFYRADAEVPHSLPSSDIIVLLHGFLTSRYDWYKVRAARACGLDADSNPHGFSLHGDEETAWGGSLSPFSLVPKILKDGGLLSPIITCLMNFFVFSRGLGAVFGPYTQPSQAEYWDMWMAVQTNNGNVLVDSYIPITSCISFGLCLWCPSVCRQSHGSGLEGNQNAAQSLDPGSPELPAASVGIWDHPRTPKERWGVM